MVVSNAHEKIGFLHISFYKIVQIVLPIICLAKIKKCNIFTILFGKYPETLYICTPI